MSVPSISQTGQIQQLQALASIGRGRGGEQSVETRVNLPDGKTDVSEKELKERLKKGRKVNRKRAEQLRKQLNDFAGQFHTSLEFDVIPEIDQMFVKIKDARNDSLEKVLPPKYFLKHRMKMNEFKQQVLDRMA